MVIKPRSLADIRECVTLYANLNDYSFLDVSIEKSVQALLQKVRADKFVRMKLFNNEIVSWLYADSVELSHSEDRILQQIYYASKLKGIAAYRSVVELHSLMEDEGRKLGKTLLTSPGSHLDENNTFAKILEKNGWQRRGFLAIKNL